MKHATLLVLFLLSILPLFSQVLVVDISGIRNKVGLIRLALFDDEARFRSETPILVRIFDKSTMVNGNLTARLDSIPPAKYGIALLDDENRNGKLDYKLVIPKEGVGFSNYDQHGIRRPSFDEFSFLLKKNVTLHVSIRLKYY
jgi:uncharacterized protein (DUF2141 family)